MPEHGGRHEGFHADPRLRRVTACHPSRSPVSPLPSPFSLLCSALCILLLFVANAPLAAAGEPTLRLTPAAKAAGIRELPGKRITLLTDLASAPAVDELPHVFDLAFPQWCTYFGVNADEHADWHVTGCLMKDKSLFQRAGLLPDAVVRVETGFSYNYDLWVCEQASDYYRRHLLLHEGVHSFMNTVLGSCGPPWYAEGMAELLGTHRWRDGRLTLGYFPADRDDVPMWGRIKIVRDAFAERRAWRLADVLAYNPATQPGREPYGWCWAIAALLDGHPRYQARFRTLPRLVNRPDFTDPLRRLLGPDWDHLDEDWQVFVADVDYGYDFQRTAIDFSPGRPISPTGGRATIHADRGWQNSGIAMKAGTTYQLRAAGRYQVATAPRIWWCEPNGVSIRYCRGQPLGILLAAVLPDGPAPGPCPLIVPSAVGLQATLTPKHSGTLFLRINDSAAELHDNAGTLAVEVR